jgi:peptidoglycan hydrolase-like protein with peptidoglycan-binding domain
MKLPPLISAALLLLPAFDTSAQSSSRVLSAKEREAQVRLQVFLDGALFGPGKVDGLQGEFTTKAIVNFQKAHGLEPNGIPESLPIPQDAPAYTEYTIKPDDRKFVGNLPSKPAEQAHLHYLPYDSFAEFLTERFHCSTGLLEHLNPFLKLEQLKIGDTIRVPAVTPFQIEDIRAIAQLPERPEFKSRSIIIWYS